MRYVSLSVLAMSLLLRCVAAELTPVQSAAVDQVVASLETLFSRNFQVRLRSAELNALLEKQVAEQSARMGMPVAIQISHFNLRMQGGESTCTLSLTPETPMREMLEPQANQMLESVGLSRMLAAASLDALAEGGRVLKGGREQGKLTVNRETEEYIDLNIGFSGQALLPGFNLNGALFRISKKKPLLTAMQLQGEEGKILKVMITYQEIDTITCPAAMEMRHNLGAVVGGVALPPALKTSFDHYRFAD